MKFKIIPFHTSTKSPAGYNFCHYDHYDSCTTLFTIDETPNGCVCQGCLYEQAMKQFKECFEFDED